MIMIGHNNINTSRNNFTNIFSDINHNSYVSKKTALEAKSAYSRLTEVDTDIQKLSSRKLWQILKLNQIKGCELDVTFVEQVKDELLHRNDFDNGQAWCEPH
jgi:hypothetical protein